MGEETELQEFMEVMRMGIGRLCRKNERIREQMGARGGGEGWEKWGEVVKGTN